MALAIAGCQPPGAGTPTTRPAPPPQTFTLMDIVGGWQWIHRATEQGTSRIEKETWRFRPTVINGVSRLAGRYIRDVEVRSDDRVPFQCNQRPWYRQRAVFDVVVELAPAGFVVRETEYRAEPSPCDHGFRHMADYEAELGGQRLWLRWGTGVQTLWRVDDELAELPEDPWPSTPEITGAWRWDMTSFDDEGNVHDESEWWHVTRKDETHLHATYRRRVTVRSPDGSTITCAGAPSWTFDDAYILDARREEEHWRFYEVASEPGDHPCLRVTPRRSLDEATAEQLGDYLILEWRGKRRQVLHRGE